MVRFLLISRVPLRTKWLLLLLLFPEIPDGELVKMFIVVSLGALIAAKSIVLQHFCCCCCCCCSWWWCKHVAWSKPFSPSTHSWLLSKGWRFEETKPGNFRKKKTGWLNRNNYAVQVMFINKWFLMSAELNFLRLKLNSQRIIPDCNVCL